MQDLSEFTLIDHATPKLSHMPGLPFPSLFASCHAMTKSDIVDRIAQATGLTKLETEVVVDGFLKTVIDALSRDEHVELRGFGTFRVKERAPRTGRNPRTGEIVELEGQFVPHFKVSRELRQQVDQAIKTSQLRNDKT
jgi:integration host factor beta subunit